MRRRGLGPGALEQVMSAAVRLSGSNSADSPQRSTHAKARGDADTDPLGTDGDLALILKPIIAWGSCERGRSDLGTILELTRQDPAIPSEVAAAVSALERLDLRAWSGEWAIARYDPMVPLRDIVGQLSDPRRAVLEDRLIALGPRATLAELGARFGVTRERIRQFENRLSHELAELGRHGAGPLGRATRRVAEEIGTAMQVSSIARVQALCEVTSGSIDDLETRLLLWLAGPYELVDDWLVRQPARASLDASRAALDGLTVDGPAQLADAEDAVDALGVNEEEVHDWIVSIGGYRIHDDLLVRWRGSMADRAETVLRLNGAPLSRDELVERLGPDTNPRSMTSQLTGDPRFKRTGVRHYGLAGWEDDEYTGVADEIAQEIERHGGAATLEQLIEHVTTTYGVAENSVRAYASGPRFERGSDGLLRLRRGRKRRARSRPIETTRGAFLIEDRWSLRIRVSREHLRGSGTPIPESIARVFGLEPLESLELPSLGGPVRLAWPSLQPSVGSIRQQLDAAGAEAEDLVFLAVEHGVLLMRHVPRSRLRSLDGVARLAAEMGLGDVLDDELSAIVRALALESGASMSAVARRLRSRGEDDLASLALPETDDGPLVLSLGGAKFVEARLSR